MRRFLLAMVAVLAVSAFASSAQAQALTPGGANAGDPFFLYYGFFLPRQQALSQQRGPEYTINAASAARREAAIVDREDLYNPSNPYDTDDPLGPFGRQSGRSRHIRPSVMGIVNSNLRGTGVPGYHMRYGTGDRQYFPSMRVGRVSNPGIAVSPPSPRGGGSGSRFMPSPYPGGLPRTFTR